MKKFSMMLLFVLMMVPAIAADANVTGALAATSATADVIKKKNPNTKFPRGLEFGLGVSPTSGLNGFIGYNNKKFNSFWAKRFGFRFDFASFSPIKNRLNRKINDSVGNDGIKIEDNLKINNIALNAKHYGALVDFYPFGDTWFLGGWRVSGGYVSGRMNLNSDIYGKNIGGNIEFELNGNKYYYTGGEMRGTANISWDYRGPYLGTGFDLGILWGFKIYVDTGVVFANRPAHVGLDVPLTGLYDNNGVAITENSSDPIIQQAYADFRTAQAAELQKAQRELDKYPYYPLVKIGFMYRF